LDAYTYKDVAKMAGQVSNWIQKIGNQIDVTLLYTIDRSAVRNASLMADDPFDFKTREKIRIKAALEIANEIIKRVKDAYLAYGITTNSEVAVGDPKEEIVEIAKKLKAFVVIFPKLPKNIDDVTCPIMILHPTERTTGFTAMVKNWFSKQKHMHLPL